MYWCIGFLKNVEIMEKKNSRGGQTNGRWWWWAYPYSTNHYKMRWPHLENLWGKERKKLKLGCLSGGEGGDNAHTVQRWWYQKISSPWWRSLKKFENRLWCGVLWPHGIFRSLISGGDAWKKDDYATENGEKFVRNCMHLSKAVKSHT